MVKNSKHQTFEKKKQRKSAAKFSLSATMVKPVKRANGLRMLHKNSVTVLKQI